MNRCQLTCVRDNKLEAEMDQILYTDNVIQNKVLIDTIYREQPL